MGPAAMKNSEASAALTKFRLMPLSLNHKQMLMENSPRWLFGLSNELPNLDAAGFLKNSTGYLTSGLVTCRRLIFPRPKQDFEIIPIPCRELFVFPSSQKCFLVHDLILSSK